jgi:hypothetical protein
MKKQIILTGLLIVGATVFLTGCGEEEKSVAYYKEHLDEARKKHAECAKFSDDPECVNAKAALWRAGEVTVSGEKPKEK